MLNELRSLPWLLAFTSAAAVVLVARRCGRSWVPWALGAAVFSLAASTIALGLMSAVFLPVSHEAVVFFRLKSVGAALLAAAIPDALILANLWFGRRRPPASSPETVSDAARGTKVGSAPGLETNGP